MSDPVSDPPSDPPSDRASDRASDPRDRARVSVAEWLDGLGLARYASAFEAHDLTPDLLGELDHGLLKEIGIPVIGHRLRILKAARELGPPAGREPLSAPVPPAGPSERSRGRSSAGGPAPIELIGQPETAAAAAPDPPAALPGRDREVGMLADRWRRARAGPGHALLITGAAGAGKSRLVCTLSEQLARRLEVEPHRRVTVHCSQRHADEALHPVSEALVQAFVETRLPAGGQPLDRLRAWLSALGMAAEQHIPVLGPWLGVPVGARYERVIAPGALLDSLVALLERLCDEQPLLLVAEDLQWADVATLGLLGRAIEALRGAPALVLLTARPEFSAPPGGAWRGLERLVLEPLPERPGGPPGPVQHGP